MLGDTKRAPTAPEIAAVLERPGQSVVVNLLGLSPERPEFFQTFLPAVMELRSRKGHPHWMIIDEAHHVLPSQRGGRVDLRLPKELGGVMLIPMQPDHVHTTVIRELQSIVAVG